MPSRAHIIPKPRMALLWVAMGREPFPAGRRQRGSLGRAQPPPAARPRGPPPLLWHRAPVGPSPAPALGALHSSEPRLWGLERSRCGRRGWRGGEVGAHRGAPLISSSAVGPAGSSATPQQIFPLFLSLFKILKASRPLFMVAKQERTGDV